MVTIAVTAERDGEPRVAVSPETVKKLIALGCTVRVQAGAGAHSRFSDDILKAQGATIAAGAAETLAGADILLKVRGRTGPEANDVDDKKFHPSIQDRVNGVASEIGDVTSPPTQIQRETLDLAMTDLAREAARLNVLLTTKVPALNRALDAAGVPWTVGRTVR